MKIEVDFSDDNWSDPTEDEDRIEDIVNRLSDIQSSINTLKEREEELKDELREILDYGRYLLPEYKLEVQHNRRINEKRAVETYGEKVCKMKWDSTTAKKVLSGDEYDALYDEGKKKIVVTYEG